MSIIRYTKDENIRYAYLNIFPDQFKTEKEKQEDSYVKNTMDYFSNKAYAEYIKNRETFVPNYDLVKGILRPSDFYQEDPDVKSFMESLTKSMGLPKHVKNYSILSAPLNELVGGVTKRPDKYKIKAFDADSKSEELQFKTDLLQKFILNNAKRKIYEKAALEGTEISEEEIEQMSLEQVKEELDSYTSIGEKWANHVLTAQKLEFNIKELSEDAFRDLCISANEYFHIYEDNSKLGYNVVTENPKNVWNLLTPDKKYTSDVTGRNKGAYASGTVHVMELSEIIETFPDLTKEEIDHLRSSLQDYGLINVRESNLGNPDAAPGIDSINYDTFDPLVLQTRMMIESEMKDQGNNDDGLRDFLGLTNNVTSFGYKYVVVRAYWASKKKIGRVVYIDELGNEQSTLVDENYKSGNIPTQISLEWAWINQWYQGVKIGPDIYHMKPFDLLPYNPIIGTRFEIKNTEARSFVDMMKPFQVIYNICINQMYELLGKEIGNVASINHRRIPRTKDGDAQDDLDIWELDAREKGIIFDDDSPENTKAPVSNTSVARNVDLTRSNEIQTRYNLASQIKAECWELVGMSRQRLGSISASESATGTNAALQQSYTQTEPLYVAHEYVLGQLYQAIIDASQYIESSKEHSTISYINSEGVSSFIKVNGNDIKFRDLKIFPTNRPEDTQMFNDIRNLGQAILQNGGTPEVLVELYSTNSIREIKKTFKNLRERQEAIQQQQAQQQQAQLEQTNQNLQLEIEARRIEEQERMLHESRENELDRLSKEKIAIIAATGYGQVQSEDLNKDGVPDAFEVSKLNMEEDARQKENYTKLAELQQKASESANKFNIEKEKLAVARENMKNDLAIAKENAKGRNKKKS